MGIFSTHWKISAIIFSRVITKKPSKVVKFTKIDQTLRNTYLTGPKGSRIKLVVPSNLLKQENVCIIPREGEHPSRTFSVEVFAEKFVDFSIKKRRLSIVSLENMKMK